MRKEVMSFFGRLNYISWFIDQSKWCVILFLRCWRKTPRQSGLKSVRLLLTLSRTICQIHRYWFLCEKRVLCCCICQSQIMHMDAYWSTQRESKEVKTYLLCKQEVYSIRVSIHSVGENVLCFDLACPEVETLFIFVYHISHFQNGSIEVYFPKGDVDRKFS